MIGEKVECIRDNEQGEFGDVVHFGDIYAVTGTYEDEGHEMLLLDSLKRRHPFYGNGWSSKRFKVIIRRAVKQNIRETANV